MDSNHELFYVVKLVQKGVASSDMVDSYGHKIYAGERYFEGDYLEKVTEKKNFVTFCILNKKDQQLYLRPKEVQHMFIDINPVILSSY